MKLGLRKRLRRISARARRAVTPHALILMYHRVGTQGADPWSLRVSPTHFAEHLDVLRRFGSPLPLQRLVADQQRGRIRERSIAITFDDGYADNLLYARPLLERFDVPATVFVATGQLGQAREFWWDELELLLDAPVQQAELWLDIGGQTRRWQLHEEQARSRLYVSVWEALQPLSAEQQGQALAAIRSWVGVSPLARPSHRALRPDELRALNDGDLVEIGAHTISHPLLSAHPADAQHEEIAGSRAQLEQILDRPVTGFSYPYGDCRPETVRLVREAGLVYACSTMKDAVWRGSEPYRLPRHQVDDWSGAEFEQRLTQWLGDA